MAGGLKPCRASLFSILLFCAQSRYLFCEASQEGVWLVTAVAEAFTNFDHSSWRESGGYDPCRGAWKYVTCDKDNRVIQLNLANLGLTGTLDPKIGEIYGLRELRLENNNISGPLPNSLGMLTQLEVLDVSSNSFSGSVPESLAALPQLVLLNLARNNLSGAVPPILTHSLLACNAFSTNPGLCSDNCRNLEECTPGAHSKWRAHFPWEAAAVAAVVLALASYYSVLIVCCFRRAHKLRADAAAHDADTEMGFLLPAHKKGGGSTMLHSVSVKIYSLKEVMDATGNFSDANVIGRGDSGVVYRATFPDGTRAAVKRLQVRAARMKEDTFLFEVDYIGNAVHRNLLKIQGACVAGEERILNPAPLPWLTRVKIAAGTAEGLCYLHSWHPPLLHRSVKAANVLLEADFTPVLTDYCTTQLMGPSPFHETSQLRGSAAHLAPEYFMSGHWSDKSDVYSFGVLLLELAGRRAGGQVAKILEEGRAEKDLLDPRLLHEPPQDRQLESLLEVAVSCLKSDARERPSMAECLSVLQRRKLSQKRSPSKKDSSAARGPESAAAPMIQPPPSVSTTSTPAGTPAGLI
eukprot:jgi/Mesen1/5599/ME000282S04757